MNKCLTCSLESLSKNLCTECNNDAGFYPKEKDPLNTEGNINCYNGSIEGYYLDTNEKIFKECFFTCKSCNGIGENSNHKCTKCSSKFPLEYKINDNYKNCFIKCSYYYYYDHYDKNFHCTNSFTCPDNYPNLIAGKNECVTDIIASNINSKEPVTNDYYSNVDINVTNDCLTSSKEIEVMKENISYNSKNLTEIEKYNLILENIDSLLTSGKYNTSKIDSGKDDFISFNKILITLTRQKTKKTFQKIIL